VIAILNLSTARSDYSPIRRSVYVQIWNKLRRMADFILFKYFGVWTFQFYNYIKTTGDNRGDIAIRIASEQLIHDYIDDTASFLEIGWHELDETAAAIVNDTCSAIVVAGGGYIFIDSSGNVPFRIEQHLKALRNINRPIFGLSIGVNRLLAPQCPDLAHVEKSDALCDLLSRFSLISVRDGASKSVLERFVDTCSVHVVADPALFLKRSPHLSLPETKNSFELWVGINVNFHGKHSTSLLKHNVECIAQVLQKLATTRICRFFYFVHTESERIIPKILAEKRIAVTVVDCQPVEMLAWYGMLDIHLCGMLHSSILSINAGVPTVNYGYDVKNLAFFKLMGFDDFYVHAQEMTPDGLWSLVQRILVDLDGCRRRLEERKEVLRKDMERFLTDTKAILT